MMERIWDMRKPKTNLQAGGAARQRWRMPALVCCALRVSFSGVLPMPLLRLLSLPGCSLHLFPRLQIKQSVLLRYRSMAAFLKQHAPNIYAEARPLCMLRPLCLLCQRWEAAPTGGRLGAPRRVRKRRCSRPAYRPVPHSRGCLLTWLPCLVQVRGAYVDKVGAKMLDLFRTYWAAMERLEASRQSRRGRGVAIASSPWSATARGAADALLQGSRLCLLCALRTLCAVLCRRWWLLHPTPWARPRRQPAA